MDKARLLSATGIVSMADEIRGLCAVITKIARADLQCRLDSFESGISAIEHGVLRHLSRGVRSMAEISRLMGIAPSTLVYVVDALVKKKLVRRGKDPNDRRREPLSLAKKGADLFARIPKMDANSVLVQSLHRMGEAERRQLLDLVKQFVSGLPGAARLQSHSESGEAGSLASDPPSKRHGNQMVRGAKKVKGAKS